MNTLSEADADLLARELLGWDHTPLCNKEHLDVFIDGLAQCRDCGRLFGSAALAAPLPRPDVTSDSNVNRMIEAARKRGIGLSVTSLFPNLAVCLALASALRKEESCQGR
jgi:hypothetical protein